MLQLSQPFLKRANFKSFCKYISISYNSFILLHVHNNTNNHLFYQQLNSRDYHSTVMLNSLVAKKEHFVGDDKRHRAPYIPPKLMITPEDNTPFGRLLFLANEPQKRNQSLIVYRELCEKYVQEFGSFPVENQIELSNIILLNKNVQQDKETYYAFVEYMFASPRLFSNAKKIIDGRITNPEDPKDIARANVLRTIKSSGLDAYISRQLPNFRTFSYISQYFAKLDDPETLENIFQVIYDNHPRIMLSEFDNFIFHIGKSIGQHSPPNSSMTKKYDDTSYMILWSLDCFIRISNGKFKPTKLSYYVMVEALLYMRRYELLSQLLENTSDDIPIDEDIYDLITSSILKEKAFFDNRRILQRMNIDIIHLAETFNIEWDWKRALETVKVYLKHGGWFEGYKAYVSLFYVEREFSDILEEGHEITKLVRAERGRKKVLNPHFSLMNGENKMLKREIVFALSLDGQVEKIRKIFEVYPDICNDTVYHNCILQALCVKKESLEEAKDYFLTHFNWDYTSGKGVNSNQVTIAIVEKYLRSLNSSEIENYITNFKANRTNSIKS